VRTEKIGLLLFSIPPHKQRKIGLLEHQFICQYSMYRD
jgi:hypothetical protein